MNDAQNIAALRFNVREWQDRARDMERERDAALAHAEALEAALARVAHKYCGTNRVSQDIRWARQGLGWDYEKGCAESVEAVRASHAALTGPGGNPIPQGTSVIVPGLSVDVSNLRMPSEGNPEHG